MQALFIAFVVIAAIGGAQLSFWLTDVLVTQLRVEPAEWLARRLRSGNALD